mgnify:CR=1 FL=1
MSNKKALETIEKLKKAIEKYGSVIKIQTITEGVYDPRNPEAGTTTTEVTTKALISSEASKKVAEGFKGTTSSSAYEMAMKLYNDTTITKDNKISFRGNVYDVLYVSESILQDTTYLYEILVKK